MTESARRVRVLCFDFDGVIVESAALKVDAFVALYQDRDPAHVQEIRDFCEYHGGVSRQRKIEHIQNNILREPLSQGELDALAERFRTLVLENVLTAPVVPGAREFLETHSLDFTCFVVSGTPHEEINAICEARGFTPFFRAIGGAPTEKAAWIRTFLEDAGAEPSEALMIGDAPTDYDAAAETGVGFIGIGSRRDSRLPESVPLMPDLTRLIERIREV